MLSEQGKAPLLWKLRTQGFYLLSEQSFSMEIAFSAGKIRSDFRSEKCLGGKFLTGWKGSPNLPGVCGESGRENEQQRF